MAKDLDAKTIEALRYNKVPIELLQRTAAPKDTPVTVTAGLPSLQTYTDPTLRDTGVGGYVTSKFSPIDAMFLEPNAKAATAAHEGEHLLARRQLETPAAINSVFDQIAGDKKIRSSFVQDASRVYPYLQEKYGLNSGYFSPDMLKYQGSLAPNLAYEQLATLASIEATTGVDLTKDPYLRKNLFKDRETREIYNALTGLRQTRLDSKDLPPHTRQKETGSNFFTDLVEKLKTKDFGKKAGGLIDKPLPGGKKLI